MTPQSPAIYSASSDPSSSDISSPSDSDMLKWCIYRMASTMFSKNVYLGYASHPLQVLHLQDSFVGGSAVWLWQPHGEMVRCEGCGQGPLTTLLQLYCPLAQPQATHRVLYLLYCNKCRHSFRCIRQQAAEDTPRIQMMLPRISPGAVEIDSSALAVKDLRALVQAANAQIREDAMEEVESDQEGEEQAVVEDYSSEEEGNQKQEKDGQFQAYRRIMGELEWPILIYGNVEVPYNCTPLNPIHYCKNCKASMVLELQITAKFLTLFQELFGLDWGGLFIYTCQKSCGNNQEECVVVQYEVDAIGEEQIAKLTQRKKQKNKKNKKKKQNTKQVKQVQEKQQKQEQQGDWD